MKEIDQELNKWIKNSIIRAEVRKIKHKNENENK